MRTSPASSRPVTRGDARARGRFTRPALLALAFLLIAAPLPADLAQLIHQWSDAFAGYADPNTGLTMFPTLLIPMGGRSEGMGTAYTALSNDASLTEANPAGSAGPALSFFHHNWLADSALDAVVYTTRLGNIGFAFGAKFFYCPFTEYDSVGEKQGRGYFSEALVVGNVSMEVLKIGDFARIAAGINVKGIYRNVPEALAPGQSAFAVPLDIGILGRFRILGDLSLGAVLKNLGQEVASSGFALPTIASFGMAYSPFAPFTIALDANLPISFDQEELPAEQLSLAAGVELAVTRFLSLRGGVHLKADNPKISVGVSVGIRDLVVTANYNLDLMGSLNPSDMVSVEASIGLP